MTEEELAEAAAALREEVEFKLSIHVERMDKVPTRLLLELLNHAGLDRRPIVYGLGPVAQDSDGGWWLLRAAIAAPPARNPAEAAWAAVWQRFAP